ncbi:serine hydrolase [Amycolatopsis sp. YIM 10]|uniref:serine hydrolase domain-containing protein n=1 Tax=Amycolatopsis sp. YIM 10 TaxID=2653857 RepID=UPI0012A9D36C|nr:serine hydrolase domain-containing protein [Amycolatopsis sp. YIM 10]QFU94721.1 D-alanyl-D-alanine carboxypeptidase precursor [Amycolatopsis sp. YIM 10]
MRASTLGRAAVVVGLAAVMAGAVPAAATPSRLQQELDHLVRVDGVPGAQAVVSERGRGREVTSGAGDLRTGQPFPHQARIRIGSNTKTFVATVVLQLVAEDRIGLDHPVEQYLPGAVRGDRRITVRHLLQHTSGLADYLEKVDPLDTRWRYRTGDELARIAMTLPSHFDPGAKWEYSNTNYVLAGLLVERVTGTPLATELTRRIITPLGLHSTYYPLPGETGIRGPHPRGYHEVDGERIDYTRQDPSWGGAAGAMVSTGQDLNRFFTALLSGRLLPPEQLAEMKRTVPADVFPAPATASA